MHGDEYLLKAYVAATLREAKARQGVLPGVF